MLFLSTGYNLRITVEPTDYEYGVGGRRSVIRGKAIQFAGAPGGIGRWDSLAAQKAHGWSDAEREQVERFLLETDEFSTVPEQGVGRKPTVYLAPGQEVEGIEAPSAEPVAYNKCTSLTKSAELCKGKPLAGTDKCSVHTPKEAEMGELAGAVV